MKQLTALGGNIFAGLFTVGVKRAGYKILGHLEHGPYGVATAQLNHPELVGRTWTHPSAWPAPKMFGKVNLMFCNPPCAAWSSARASKKGSWEEHVDRLAIIDHLTTYGIALQPDAWVWESVTNAWRHGRGFIDRIAGAWLDAGYHVTVIKQNNMYLGVPQNRPRILVTTHRYPLIYPALTVPMTVGQALKGLRPTKAQLVGTEHTAKGWEMLWERSGGDGGNFNMRRVFQTLTREELKGVSRSPSFMVRRLRLDAPSQVNLDREKLWHPTQPRMLTWTESLALCGLDPDWKSTYTSGAAWPELSRAVMPPVGQWLATAVADGIATGKRLRKPTYQVFHCDAGPEHLLTETLVPEGDHRFGDLRRWDQVVAPPVKTRKKENLK